MLPYFMMDLPIFTKNGDTSFLDLLCKVERCHYGFQKEAAICSCTLQEGGGRALHIAMHPCMFV